MPLGASPEDGELEESLLTQVRGFSYADTPMRTAHSSQLDNDEKEEQEKHEEHREAA